LDEQNDPWWVAKDVCSILGLANTTMALKALDDDEKKILPILPAALNLIEGIPVKRGNPNNKKLWRPKQFDPPHK
jgi:prophage antirepressor-like protein